LVKLGLLLMVLQQPQIQVTVDRTDAEVGDEIVLTVKVSGPGGVASDADPPPTSGLDLVGTSFSSVFTSRDGVGVRETTWVYRFLAAEAGRAVIGPIRARVGADVVDGGELSIDVTAVGGGLEEAFDDRVGAIVDAAPGPGSSDDVTVTVVPSRDTIILGEQLDIVVVAWFPRDIRSRLRTRPTLTPPELQGAWTYPRTAALGASDSREVDGRMFDLFVHHQVAFPLTPGELGIGRATVSYSLPIRTSILSREVPQEVQSERRVVAVLPQPSANRPVPFTGAAAQHLRFAVVVDTGDFGVGNASTITARVSGLGNVSLWPEPAFAWPEGVRVYPGRTDVDIATEQGLVGGTKTFTYLVAPDSTGTYDVPPPRYPYFALDSGRYIDAATDAFRLVARAARSSPSRGSEILAIMAGDNVQPLDRLAARTRLWMVLLVLGGPPLLALLVRHRPAVRWRRRRAQPALAVESTLEALGHEFRSKLERLVPIIEAREGDGLSSALRAAGVEAPVATHASKVRDRLRQVLYGPEGALDSAELAAEIQEVIRALPGGPRGPDRTSRTSAAVMVLLCAASAPVAAQSMAAEQLYEAGAYRAAADSFSLRAGLEPGESSHWFNTGAALYGAGDEVQARVAWIRAARLQPRSTPIRDALQLVPALDAHARSNTWVAPMTVVELLAVAGVLWVLAWLAYLAWGSPRRLMVPLSAALLVAGFAGYLHSRYQTPVGLLLDPTVALREAPFGGAPPVASLGAGIAVRILREEGAWLLVVREGLQGWVLAEDVGRV
jgi:hypothetical protein